MTHWSGSYDMHHIDTDPGETGPFAPPSGWEGDGGAYRALIRDRYRGDVAAKQQIGVVALRLREVWFTGRWADDARAIAQAVAEARNPRAAA